MKDIFFDAGKILAKPDKLNSLTRGMLDQGSYDGVENNFAVDVSKTSVALYQRSVSPETQSIPFDIVSRCFENKKNNNCCETKLFKNAI